MEPVPEKHCLNALIIIRFLKYCEVENTAFKRAAASCWLGERQKRKTWGERRRLSFETVPQKRPSHKELAKQGLTDRFQDNPPDNHRGRK
jgi:hypothetical protein